MTTVRVDGVKDTLKALRDIDPKMRRQFDKDVKTILKPMVNAVKAAITSQRFPSGTARRWAPGGRGDVFPLEGVQLAKTVKPGVNTGRKKASVFFVTGTARGWGVWEFATSSNSLGQAFTSYGGNPARTMWPEANRNLDAVLSELNKALEEVERITNMEVA